MYGGLDPHPAAGGVRNHVIMKTVLITGAAGGIGSAAARAMLAEGYTVYGLDRNRPDHCPGLRFIPVDLTDPDSVAEAYSLCEKTGIRFDFLVHAAGIYDLDSLVEISEERFQRIFEINLFGVYRINKTFLPLLRKGAGILILTSELAPLDPLPFTGLYAVSKSALDQYAASLRMELQLLGIRVMILRPGAVDTGLLDISIQCLDAFCQNTSLYHTGADRFRRIVSRVESRKISPEKLASFILSILKSRYPRPVYHINRNPFLRILSCLPDRMQCFIIRKLVQ